MAFFLSPVPFGLTGAWDEYWHGLEILFPTILHDSSDSLFPTPVSTLPTLSSSFMDFFFLSPLLPPVAQMWLQPKAQAFTLFSLHISRYPGNDNNFRCSSSSSSKIIIIINNSNNNIAYCVLGTCSLSYLIPQNPLTLHYGWENCRNWMTYTKTHD